MDHVADIKKYTDSVDEAVVASLEKTYRLVLSKPDSAVVAFGDPDELATVKQNFLVKKLGLTDADGLDEAIAAVGEKMKGVARKDRLTVYYLLAEHLGKLDTLA
ncbi:MAG: DUF2853 family protein [Arachnia sp.]